MRKEGSVQIGTRHYRALLTVLFCLAAPAPLFAQARADAKDMALVGTSDLQARSAYQPTIHKQGERWIAYIGHHGGSKEVPKPRNPLTGADEFNGTSILDVTDPRRPKVLFHIPGDEGFAEDGGAQMVRVCDGKLLPKADAGAVYMLRTFGNQAHEIWNTTDPSAPKLITRLTGLKGTHKNWWECDTGIAYLVSGVPGWRVPRMTEVYDLSDPSKPVKIRDFGLPGQQPGAGGPVPTRLHGAISTGPKGNRIYFGYGTNEGGVLQIVDRDKLLNGAKEPTEENLIYPQVGRLDMSPLTGAHTTFPVLELPVAEFAKDKVGKVRNFVVVTNEQIKNECEEARQFVWMVDVTVERYPLRLQPGVLRRRAAVSAAAAGASARMPPTRARRRSTTSVSCSFRTLMPGCAPSTSVTPTISGKSPTTSPPSRTTPTSAASAWRTARSAARWRSRPTTLKSTSAASYMPSIGPIPACTS
jgi:hypothetical protein